MASAIGSPKTLIRQETLTFFFISSGSYLWSFVVTTKFRPSREMKSTVPKN